MTAGQRRAFQELLPRYSIPSGYAELDFQQLFGRCERIVVEIGFGDGTALLDMANAHPTWGYIGVEVYRPGVGNLLRRLADTELSNVRIAVDDAVDVLSRRIPRESLDEVLILFPDPWPKKRHHKRRLVQSSFVDLVVSRLRTGGRLRIATDSGDYAQHIADVVGDEPRFCLVAYADDLTSRPNDRPPTKYEQRGTELGNRVWHMTFERTAPT